MKNVILTEKAYMNLLAEVNEHSEDTTAGLFLGYQEDELWYILECMEPGPRSNFSSSGFNLDEDYIRYRVDIYRRIYKNSIEVLGLWHVHAGYIRMFTASDDLTNRRISQRPGGSIAAMITLKDGFHMSMFYVPHDLHYDKISWIVGDALIPKQYSIHQPPEYFTNMIRNSRDSHSYRYSGRENPRTAEQPGERQSSQSKQSAPHKTAADPESYSSHVHSYDEEDEVPGLLYRISAFPAAIGMLIHRLNDRIYRLMAPFDKDSDGEEFMEDEDRKPKQKKPKKKHHRHHLFRRGKDAQRDEEEQAAYEASDEHETDTPEGRTPDMNRTVHSDQMTGRGRYRKC